MDFTPVFNSAGDVVGFRNQDHFENPGTVAIGKKSFNISLDDVNNDAPTTTGDCTPEKIHVQEPTNQENTPNLGNENNSESLPGEETPVSPKLPIWRTHLLCSYCKKTGEEEFFYRSHAMRDKKGQLMCPILMKKVCPLCGATGENAHILEECSKYRYHPPPTCNCDEGSYSQSCFWIKSGAEKTSRDIYNRSDQKNSRIKVRCVFCRYRILGSKIAKTHFVKDENGIVTCPLLQQQVCPLCEATGPYAHTVQFCPFNPEGKPPQNPAYQPGARDKKRAHNFM